MAPPDFADALRTRYPAALIDEFQDTDPLQFAIFDALYGNTPLPLYLVGDPKAGDLRLPQCRPAPTCTRAAAPWRYALEGQPALEPPLIDALNGLFGANPSAFIQPLTA